MRYKSYSSRALLPLQKLKSPRDFGGIITLFSIWLEIDLKPEIRVVSTFILQTAKLWTWRIENRIQMLWWAGIVNFLHSFFMGVHTLSSIHCAPVFSLCLNDHIYLQRKTINNKYSGVTTVCVNISQLYCSNLDRYMTITGTGSGVDHFPVP